MLFDFSLSRLDYRNLGRLSFTRLKMILHANVASALEPSAATSPAALRGILGHKLICENSRAGFVTIGATRIPAIREELAAQRLTLPPGITAAKAVPDWLQSVGISAVSPAVMHGLEAVANAVKTDPEILRILSWVGRGEVPAYDRTLKTLVDWVDWPDRNRAPRAIVEVKFWQNKYEWSERAWARNANSQALDMQAYLLNLVAQQIRAPLFWLVIKDHRCFALWQPSASQLREGRRKFTVVLEKLNHWGRTLLT